MSKSGRATLDAMLRHLAGDRDPQDFPSTAYVRQGLIETAGKRGLIEWNKERRRYALTPAGWRRLRRGRGLGLAALAISAAAGATVGAAALAVLWLPGDGSRPAAEHPPSVSRAQSAGVITPTLPPTLVSTPAAPPAVAADAPPSVVPATPVAPPMVAEPPTPKQADGEAAPDLAKPVVVKKSRHKTAGAHRRRAWTAGRYRDERFAGSGRVLR